MKFKLFFTAAIMIATMAVSTTAQAQKFSDLDKSPMDAASFPNDYKIAEKVVKIQYGRPQLKGRELSTLAPNGKVWRTGANEAPEITFYSDMKMGGKTIKAGTYALLTIPGENEWTIILHSGLNEWGGYFYKEENDVARATFPATMSDDSLEAFSIVFTEGDNGVDMHLGWDKARVKVSFTK